MLVCPATYPAACPPACLPACLQNVAAVVLRIDSPGGDALASDLMWREIQELGKVGVHTFVDVDGLLDWYGMYMDEHQHGW